MFVSFASFAFFFFFILGTLLSLGFLTFSSFCFWSLFWVASGSSWLRERSLELDLPASMGSSLKAVLSRAKPRMMALRTSRGSLKYVLLASFHWLLGCFVCGWSRRRAHLLDRGWRAGRVRFGPLFHQLRWDASLRLYGFRECSTSVVVRWYYSGHLSSEVLDVQCCD